MQLVDESYDFICYSCIDYLCFESKHYKVPKNILVMFV
jgi:hypothetical protein